MKISTAFGKPLLSTCCTSDRAPSNVIKYAMVQGCTSSRHFRMLSGSSGVSLGVRRVVVVVHRKRPVLVVDRSNESNVLWHGFHRYEFS